MLHCVTTREITLSLLCALNVLVSGGRSFGGGGMIVCAVSSFLLSEVMEFGGNKYCGDKVLTVIRCSMLGSIGNFCASGGRS